MQPVPDEALTGSYGGSRLTSDETHPDQLAFDGRGDLAHELAREAPDPEDARILDAIAEEAGWMADVLQRLVRADTTLGNEEAGQVIVRDVLRDLDLDAVDVRMDEEALRAHPLASPFDWETDGKANVVATWAPGSGATNGGRSLILNGHIDVVSPEPLSQWGERDPFGGDHEDGWVYGRGAADMKCGLAAIFGAVRALRRLGLTPGAPVHVESVVEEECSGNGTLQTLLAGYTADAAVVAEPFGAAITTSQVGVLWFKVRITGVPGHAAEGRNATNAIEKSLSVIQCAPRARGRDERRAARTVRPVHAPDQPERRRDPGRRLGLDGAGRLRDAVPDRPLPRPDGGGPPEPDRAGRGRRDRRSAGHAPRSRTAASPPRATTSPTTTP